MDFESHLYLGNLNSTVTHTDLKELLSQFGEVHGVFLPPETNWALARMLNEDDAQRIMKELHGQNFQGRKLIVRKAQKGRSRKSLVKPISSTETKPSIHNGNPHNTPAGSSKGQPRVVYISQQHGRNS